MRPHPGTLQAGERAAQQKFPLSRPGLDVGHAREEQWSVHKHMTAALLLVGGEDVPPEKVKLRSDPRNQQQQMPAQTLDIVHELASREKRGRVKWGLAHHPVAIVARFCWKCSVEAAGPTRPPLVLAPDVAATSSVWHSSYGADRRDRICASRPWPDGRLTDSAFGRQVGLDRRVRRRVDDAVQVVRHSSRPVYMLLLSSPSLSIAAPCVRLPKRALSCRRGASSSTRKNRQRECEFARVAALSWSAVK